jgi:hypothetical protein
MPQRGRIVVVPGFAADLEQAADFRHAWALPVRE